jgi:hypothetical protein
MLPSIKREEINNIENKLKLNSPERVEVALEYYGNSYRNEELRRDRIDARANLLIASALIAIAFITGILCDIIYDMESISLFFLIAILIVYVVIVVFIVNSISASLEVNRFEKYSMTEKHYSDYNIKESDILHLRKIRAINYYILYDKNKQINDNKENYLHKSQRNIKNAIMILLFIPLVFVINMVLSGKITFEYLNKFRSWIK